MKWFKHESNARNDVKLKILQQKYGNDGYAVYFKILEIIAEYATEKNIPEWGLVDKFHKIPTLAAECNVTPERLKEILKVCNELDLFADKNHRLYCRQILSRLDDYAKKIMRRQKAREEREKENEAPPDDNNKSTNKVSTQEDQRSPRVEQNREEKSRTEQNISVEKSTDPPPEKEEKKLRERKPPDKQTQLERIVYYLEDELSTQIVTWGKQAKALKMMKDAGYTEDQIKYTIRYMKGEDFFEDKGFDLMTVANNIPRIKVVIAKKLKKHVST